MDVKTLASFFRGRKLPRNHIILAIFITAVGVLILPGEKLTEEARRAIGGALLATGLVSIIYDYLFVRRVIGNYFELLKTAGSLELDRLYADRSKAMEDISTELHRASGDVKIMCVSGSDFFGQGLAAGAISDLITGRHSVHIRFLLLKPSSRYALIRAWIEEAYKVNREDQATLDDGELAPQYKKRAFDKSTMKARIDTAQAALRSMAGHLQDPTKLSARFYSYPPSLFIVAVNRWIFVEPYHWGVDRDYNADPIAPVIAKKVPIFKFRRTSASGTVFESHFDRLWRCKLTERFVPLASNTISSTATVTGV